MTTPEPQATEPEASDLGHFEPNPPDPGITDCPAPLPWWWVGDADWDSAYQARVQAAAEPADQPVPFTLTARAEAELTAEPDPEAGLEPEWDDADSNAYQDRVEAGLEPEAEL